MAVVDAISFAFRNHEV